MNDSDTIGAVLTATVLGLAGAVVLFLVSAAAAQYFWRGSVASAFTVSELSFGEACSLVGLCWVLFGLRPSK